MPRTAAIPSPRPVSFVEKNGSNIRASVCSFMPEPLSTTSMKTYLPVETSSPNVIFFSVVRSSVSTPVSAVITP